MSEKDIAQEDGSPERRLITIEEAARLLRLGLTKVYGMIRYEGFPVVRFGRSTRIDPAQMWQWVDDRKKQEV